MDGFHGFEAIQDDMVLLTSLHVTLLLSLELPLNLLIGELLHILTYTLKVLIYKIHLFRVSGLLKMARDLIAPYVEILTGLLPGEQLQALHLSKFKDLS